MRKAGLLVLAGVLVLVARASADVCASRWSAGQGSPHPGTVKVLQEGTGGVIQFDLSALPAKAKVYRARLYVGRGDIEFGQFGRPVLTGEEALVRCEVYPLAGAYQAGQPPRTDQKPLDLVGPWFACLDMTECVSQWVSGKKANHGLYVKALPGWQAEQTCLEIAYEGKPDALPPQASGIKILHRAGQTFITWKDTEDSFGDGPVTWQQLRRYLTSLDVCPVRYRVYRHSGPINAASITQATLLAEVRPLSSYNVNSWSLERLINQIVFANEDKGELGVYGPFSGWNMATPQGGRLIIDRFAIEDGKGLPPGTGLYVHSAAAEEKAYYAVTAVTDGVENLRQFSDANSTPQPVSEKAGKWEPVLQPSSAQFGFDFRGKRQFYVTWVAPPLCPRPSGYFNWSVLIPQEGQKPHPVELYFHGPGYSYARPPVKFLEGSIQISPHDYPFSGWYGYKDAAGTLKSCADGVVGNHTQKRIAAFMEWAKGRFPIDPARVIAVGGDGAAMQALFQPDSFAYVLVTGFEGNLLNPKSSLAYAAAWGPKSPQVKDDRGRTEWSWGELDWLLCGKRMPAVVKKDQPPPQPDASAPGFRMELPLFVCRGYSWGRDPAYGHGQGRFYYALQGTAHALHGHWAWGGRLTAPQKFTGLWQGLDLRNDTPIPAITNSSADKEGEGEGHTNVIYSWKDVHDEADGFNVTVAGAVSTFDLTPRRLANFNVRPGEGLLWEATPIAGPPGGPPATQTSPQKGQVVADANGLITIKGLEVNRGIGGLAVRIRRAK